jgi:hypothetical protein
MKKLIVAFRNFANSPKNLRGVAKEHQVSRLYMDLHSSTWSTSAGNNDCHKRPSADSSNLNRRTAKLTVTHWTPSTLTNITNSHCHSQHSPLLLFYLHPFSYIICSTSQHFNQFPNSHDSRQLTVIIFSDCDRKCSWHINVRDHYWMISVDWSQTVHCVTLLVFQLFRHFNSRLHSCVSTDALTKFHIGYADLGSWPF